MGNCLFLRARGWGIDRQVTKKLQIPGGVPGGGMVTGRIEPCIIHKCFCKGYEYGEKVDLIKGYWNPKRKMWVTTHFSEII